MLRRTEIKMKEEVIIWVDFKYEQLPTFCFYYGLIGHQERACDRKMSDSRENKVCEDQYGGWVRASILRGGRKWESGVSVTKKQLEMKGIQIQDEGARKEVGERGSWEYGKDQDKYSCRK